MILKNIFNLMKMIPLFFQEIQTVVILFSTRFVCQNIQIVMVESNRSVVTLSSILAKTQEYYALQPKATFWFGAVLSLLDHHHQSELIDDLTTPKKVELIKLITHSLAALTSFYEQEKPNSIFRLFNFMGRVIELGKDCRQYAFVVVKVVYLNALALHSVKIGQYSYALEVYGHILEIFNQGIIDNTNEVFVTALSNFLSLLKKSSKKMASRLLEVQGLLKELFFKYLTKLMFLQKDTNIETFNQCLTLLSGVFLQHRVLLAPYDKDLNSIITHFYQNSMKLKRKIPENIIEDLFRQKLKKNIAVKFTLNQDELLFYSGNRFKAAFEPKNTQSKEEPERKILKMEAMLEKTIQMLQEQKLNAARATLYRPSLNQSVTLSNRVNQSTNRTIDSVDLPKQTIENEPTLEVRRSIQRVQPLPRSITKKRQALTKQTPKIQKCNVRKSIKFKIYSIFVDIYEDGVLLSDYTNQNKKYLEWNTVSLIMERLESQFVFEDSLKCQVQNYYDIVRIFSYYLTKNDNRQICLLSRPIPLLEINSLVRLYKQEGKYLKLALMNQYDTEKFVGVIDCYISQYAEYFRQLSQNEYLGYLNDRMFSVSNDNPFQKETFYHVDYLKRKRQTTVAELSKMFEVSCLETAIEERGSIYKCLFILKNNLELLVRIVDNIKVPIAEDYHIEIRIETLERFSNEGLYIQQDKDKVESKKIRKTIEISLSHLTCYFPLFDKSIKDYLALYSKMIVDCLNSFEKQLTEVNMGGLAFEFIVHTSRTEMIEYGKYYSVVTAELIGSRERVWALVIKFYDLAFLNYKITVLINPYHGFLEGIINSTRDQQTKVMKNLLIGESLRETVSWLKKSGKMESRMNLFQYLYVNRLI